MDSTANSRTGQPRYDVAAIKQAASGRWPEILVTIGGTDPELTRLATCPELRSMDAYRTAQRHCQSVWAHGTGDDSWRHPRPWDGTPLEWHDQAEAAPA